MQTKIYITNITRDMRLMTVYTGEDKNSSKPQNFISKSSSDPKVLKNILNMSDWIFSSDAMKQTFKTLCFGF